MVLCWIALPVFAFLGLFSLKYRQLTKDSLECLFKTLTLRKCSSGLDDRIKANITGKLMTKSPASAKFFYNNYKLISVIILIVMIVATYFTSVGIYNYVKYGNCNGSDSSEFCIIGAANPFAANEVKYDSVEACLAENPNLTSEECAERCN